MSEGKFSFDPKAHTRASRAEDIAANPYTKKVSRRNESPAGPLAVGGIALVAIAAVSLNYLSTDDTPPTPRNHIENTNPDN